MDEQVEETVDTTVDSDIDAVVAEATKEVEGESPSELAPEPEPEAEETPEAEVKEEPPAEEPKAEEPEAEEQDLELSAEQLDAINKDPNLLAVYKSMQRGLTKKSQSFADRIKEVEEKTKVADFIEKDPDKALEILAEQRGRRIAPKEEDAKLDQAVDESLEKWTKLLGSDEQAKAFWPAIKDDIVKVVKEQLTPVAQRQEQATIAARQQEYAAGIAQFEASVKKSGGEYTPEVEAEMTAKMKTIQASEGATLQEYLGILHDSVMMDRNRVADKKAALARLRKAEKKDEPTVSSRTPKVGKQEITLDMDEDDAIALAVAQAEKGL
jgi:hypothetical protein